ncbi:MAG: peptidoglycan editing factor PgeF [Solobacterium sp.]|nr:peptidoglycan editing factor PgeF [Solobacterium sp.]
MDEYRLKRNAGYDTLQIRTYENEDGSELPVLKYPELEKLAFAEHCFTMRQGGVSEGVYASMNLSWSRGDDPEHVRQNYARITRLFHSDPDHVVVTRHEHGTHVIRIDGPGEPEPLDMRYDGMVTNVPGIVLCALAADCLTVVFADPVQKAVGICHSGWKGTLGRISREVIRRMQEEYGSRPEDIVCGIGPSVCGECYEINDEIAHRFMEGYPGQAPGFLVDKHNGHQLLDLRKACAASLKECGVKTVLVPDLCTMENPDYLFSHRLMGNARGNIGALIGIKEDIW